MNISEGEMLTVLMSRMEDVLWLLTYEYKVRPQTRDKVVDLQDLIDRYRAERRRGNSWMRGTFRADDFKEWQDAMSSRERMAADILNDHFNPAPMPAQSTHKRNRDRSEEELVAARAQLEEAMRHAAQTLAKFQP